MVILDAATLNRSYHSIVFLLVGNGAERGRIQPRAAEMELQNVRFFRLVDGFSRSVRRERCRPGYQQQSVSEIAFPSKVVMYLAAGRPVIASVNRESEVGRTIRGSAGKVVSAEDAPALLEAVQDFRHADLPQLGQKARTYASLRWSSVRIFGKPGTYPGRRRFGRNLFGSTWSNAMRFAENQTKLILRFLFAVSCVGFVDQHNAHAQETWGANSSVTKTSGSSAGAKAGLPAVSIGGGSSWTAGKGSFRQGSQPGGIWHTDAFAGGAIGRSNSRNPGSTSTGVSSLFGHTARGGGYNSIPDLGRIGSTTGFAVPYRLSPSPRNGGSGGGHGASTKPFGVAHGAIGSFSSSGSSGGGTIGGKLPTAGSGLHSTITRHTPTRAVPSGPSLNEHPFPN
jgi:hypothetical protein